MPVLIFKNSRHPETQCIMAVFSSILKTKSKSDCHQVRGVQHLDLIALKDPMGPDSFTLVLGFSTAAVSVDLKTYSHRFVGAIITSIFLSSSLPTSSK